MNPKRTVLGFVVLAAATVAIPLSTSATAAADPLPANPVAATPMSAAFGTAVHDTTAPAKNTNRIDCDFGGFDSGGDFGGSGLMDEGLASEGLGGPGLVSGSAAAPSGTSVVSADPSGGLIGTTGPLTSGGSAATFGG